MTTVNRENPSLTVSLGHVDQRRIGKIHRLISITLHQRAHPGGVLGIERCQVKTTALEHPPQRGLRMPASLQQIHRFGKCRPHAHQRLADRTQRIHAGVVMTVGWFDQRDQRTGVNEHARF